MLHKTSTSSSSRSLTAGANSSFELVSSATATNQDCYLLLTAVFVIVTISIMASVKVSIISEDKIYQSTASSSSPSCWLPSTKTESSSSSSSCPIFCLFFDYRSCRIGAGYDDKNLALPSPNKNEVQQEQQPRATMLVEPQQQQQQQQQQQLNYYDWNLSTEMNYRSSNSAGNSNDGYEERVFVGRFADIRERFIDHSYHTTYTHSRQEFQDQILESMLEFNNNQNSTRTIHQSKNSPSKKPKTHQEQQQTQWVIFTAGVMGAGKSFTLRKLHRQNQFPLDEYVVVDPDEIRRRLPEFDTYVSRNPETAGEYTRKEAGMMAEILTLAGLQRGHNVLVDGSLKDARWYSNYFAFLRQSFPNVKLGILHVTAPPDQIFERVQQRAKSTGRHVPKELLLRSMKDVPISVSMLKQDADFFLEIHNDSNNDDKDLDVTAYSPQQPAIQSSAAGTVPLSVVPVLLPSTMTRKSGNNNNDVVDNEHDNGHDRKGRTTREESVSS